MAGPARIHPQYSGFVTMVHRFWDTLDDLPGLTAARIEWQRRLGDNFDRVLGYLRPTGALAESIPRPNAPAYRVVCHGDGEYVGVCPENGPSISLTKAEITLHELHQRKLAEAVARVLKLDQRCEAVSGLPNVWMAGFSNQPGRNRHPVFLVFRVEDTEYREVAVQLTSLHPAGLIILSPTGRIGSERSCIGISLSALFTIDSNGLLVPAWTGESWLVDGPVPSPDSPSRVWPNPAEHTTAKVWTVKGGAIRMSTKTDGQPDGMVEFAPIEPGKLTHQMRFMQLLCFSFPKPVSLADVIQQVYLDEFATASTDAGALRKTLRKVRSLVSDLRTKKLEKANLNPDILPSLSIDASNDTGIALRLAHLHRMDDKELDEADDPAL